MSGFFRVASALRGARVFHPAGALFHGYLDVETDDGPIPAGRYAVTARLSRALGLPTRLPDILGLALRISLDTGPWDVLLATAFRPSRAVLLPARGWASARYSSVAAYLRDGDDHARWLFAEPVGRQPRTTSTSGLVPERTPVRFALTWAPARGPWSTIGDVVLDTRSPVGDPEMPSFDPVVHCPAYLHMWPTFVARMRKDAYRGSRAGRGGVLDGGVGDGGIGDRGVRNREILEEKAPVQAGRTGAETMAEKNDTTGNDTNKGADETAGDNPPKGGRPGPADHGRSGGMATRENAPEIAENPED